MISHGTHRTKRRMGRRARLAPHLVKELAQLFVVYRRLLRKIANIDSAGLERELGVVGSRLHRCKRSVWGRVPVALFLLNKGNGQSNDECQLKE